MSDYKELLERVTQSALKSYPFGVLIGEISAALRSAIAELAATESERKHWEMTAGTLRTDLEYMTRERDEAARLLNLAIDMTLDAISASNMRHAVKGCGEIARAAIRKGGE